MENNIKQFYTTAEIAKLLGISRIAVFKKIKSGEIKANKIGRNYVIAKKDLPAVLSATLNDQEKELIKAAVAKTVKEYGQTLKLLGQE